jgi:hypothetical protein
VGRGVFGYLEAEFLEAAPGCQDFKRTAVLLKLEVCVCASVAASDMHLPASPPAWAAIERLE